MSFKFKPGDLVEIIKSDAGNEGHRFVVENYDVMNLVNGNGSKELRCKCYESGIRSNGKVYKFKWAPERCLKRVNPDIDKITSSTFSEILEEITQTITVEQ